VADDNPAWPTPATIDGHPVHPALALIPLMTEGELEHLAASIKANGLIFPITLEGEVLIDGRCRLLACRMAGVEPSFAQLPEGEDTVDWICSANLIRAHNFSPTGRRAMALVWAARDLDDPDWCFAGIHPELLKQARAVLAEDPRAVRHIPSNAMTLDGVYQEILRRRRHAENLKLIWARLQAEAPSIADLVIDERLTLEEAAALHRRRKRR
jgi:hypothetical protein